ncbi:MAG: redox-regulated ATPase YchF [Oscillospiraceae bacterium]|nr:redox-regulated ATPase YchF [Oscillospiraceae bacterium]
MKLGIVGLPNVGKSTLFNAITEASNAESANYPFCTIDPNVGTVAVPDARLDFLTGLYHPKKTTPAVIEFVDIAGLVKGAHQGEGLGNQFLTHIRQTAAIIHVVRCFDDDNIIHVEGGPDPVRDIGIIELELIMSDLEQVRRRIEKNQKVAKSGDKQAKWELEVFQSLYTHLDSGQSARSFQPAQNIDLELVMNADLLSAKPVIYAANMDESSFSGAPGQNPYYDQVVAHAEQEGAQVLPISAKVEQEIVELPEQERAVFLEELGLQQSGLDRLIQCSYTLLGLISFLTAGPEEVRAWTITKGICAPQAAGKIHTDFERGFIRAEVVAFADLEECGDMNAAKGKGLVRSEGKEYVMQDGDVVLFRFNV